MEKTTDIKTRKERIFQEDTNGEYMDNRQYMVVAVSLGITHLLMELFYISVGCTPMVYINILSILTYVVSAVAIAKGHHMLSIWLMETEISLHVICACVFMGFDCGYQLWLFGTFSSIFLPFFLPTLKKRSKKQIGFYAIAIILCFEVLVYLDRHNYLPTQYRVDDQIASLLYYLNAMLAFISIMIYTSIYNQQMARKNKELQYVANHDGLTGIFNRKMINSILEAEIQRKDDASSGNLSIAILDVDFFKKINDTYGHLAGDAVLKGVAECFKRYGDEGLLYGRWGGEEFLLISPETISFEEFAKMLDGIRSDIQEREFTCDGRVIRTTASIGAAAYESGMDVDGFIRVADGRLYTAKESGRNRVVSN